MIYWKSYKRWDRLYVKRTIVTNVLFVAQKSDLLDSEKARILYSFIFCHAMLRDFISSILLRI